MGAPKQVATLPEVVEPLKQEALREGVAWCDLPRGIKLCLKWDDPGWTLIAGRHLEQLTPRDVAIICNAFDVPRSHTSFEFEQAGIYSVCVEWGKELTREVGS